MATGDVCVVSQANHVLTFETWQAEAFALIERWLDSSFRHLAIDAGQAGPG